MFIFLGQIKDILGTRSGILWEILYVKKGFSIPSIENPFVNSCFIQMFCTFKTIYCQSIFKTFFYPMTLCENIGCIRSETGHSESASLLPRAFCFANVCPLRLFPSGVQALLLPQPCVQPLSSLFGQALDLLVTVSSTRYRASTSALSTL